MSKIFVTGGTGFIGSHLVRTLIEQGHEVIISGTAGEVKVHQVMCLGYRLNELDYSNLGQIDFCFHLAANNDTTSADKKEMMTTNVNFPKELFSRLFHDHGCKKIIYASSASVYGNGPVPFEEDGPVDPLNCYAESKLMFDDWIQANNMPAVGLRYSNVFGSFEDHKGVRASLISQILKKVKNDIPLELFEFGEQKRDWVYVSDVVKLNMLLMNVDSPYKIINCGSGNVLEINQLVEIISRMTGKSPNVHYIKCPFEGKIQNNTTMSLRRSLEIGHKSDYTVEKALLKMII